MFVNHSTNVGYIVKGTKVIFHGLHFQSSQSNMQLPVSTGIRKQLLLL